MKDQDINTRFHFFSGKGGVGKTTMACATAVYFAQTGKKTLIVTTDPASNLADVFEQDIGPFEVPVESVPNLFALELDPDVSTRQYREKALAPLRDILSSDSLRVIEEQLNSPCTAEVAAFEHFTDFLQSPEYEVVIFDTAPTGHTLRLIQLPAEWSGVIEKAAREGNAGQTCVGPAAGLAESKKKFDRALKVMQDPQKTVFTFVLRPEATSIYETRRSVDELQKLHINSQELIINGIYPRSASDNSFLAYRLSKQEELIREIKSSFNLPARLIELFPQEIKGQKAIENVIEQLFTSPVTLDDYAPAEPPSAAPQIPANSGWVANDTITELITPRNGNRRTIFFAGKGGVGKTSIAATTSLWVARQGFKTLLVTTDPASHLAEVFGQAVGHKPSNVRGENFLWLAHIDPVESANEYKARVLDECRLKYDPARVKAIAEELDSPCTEEIATFEKFIDYAASEEFEVIVFDTAPTGHTLRLLKLPVDWSKQLEIKIFTSMEDSQADKETKAKFQKVISLMQDPEKTTFSFVMYPESTPIEEAARAMDDMSDIGVQTSLVVANMVIPDSIVTNDYLKQRRAMQDIHLNEIRNRFEARMVTLPLLADDLMGIEQLTKASELLYGNINRDNKKEAKVERLFGK